MLSIVNSVFDPMGVVQPVMMRAKLFLQSLWLHKWGWDDSFRDRSKLVEEWLSIVEDIKIVLRAHFKRQIKVTKQTQVHGFADASGSSYGGVVYLRTPRCKECPLGNVSFVMAKARLIPLNSPLQKKGQGQHNSQIGTDGAPVALSFNGEHYCRTPFQKECGKALMERFHYGTAVVKL